MKSLITGLFVLFTITINAQTWESLTSGNSERLNGIYAPDYATAYVVGTNGTIMKTVDTGNTWNILTSGTIERLNAVFFLNADTGFVVGENRVAIKTTDGGATWNDMTSLSSAPTAIDPYYFISINFLNDTLGYASGGSHRSPGGNRTGSVFKTIDGGTNWSRILSTGVAGNIFEVLFTTPSIGYAGEFSGIIHRTLDGGNTWQTSIYNDTISSTFIRFINDSVGLIPTFNRGIKRTEDAGATWTTVQTGFSQQLYNIDFYDENNGFVTSVLNSNTGGILQTADGGITWNNASIPNTISGILDVHCLSENLGYAVGFNGTILRYKNNDTSIPPIPDTIMSCKYWEELNSSNTNRLLSVCNVTENICYASGVNGTIIKTADRGESWITLSTNISEDIHSIYFTNKDVGFAVGDNQTTIKTTDGGVTWTTMSVAPTTSNRYTFNHIQFINDAVGFLSGNIIDIRPTMSDSGMIYKTADGGTSWNLLLKTTKTTKNNSNGITSTFFRNSQIGFANDFEGAVYRTEDGGVSWKSSITGASNSQGQLHFIDSTRGYLTTIGGKIKQTQNAGISWSTVKDEVYPNEILGIDFYDELNGYAVAGDNEGSRGLLLQTNNGGHNWVEVGLPFDYNGLINIDFYNENLGYAVGENGTILRFDLCPNNDTVFVSIPDYYSLSVNNIKISPNPASSFVNLTLNSGFGEDLIIEIYSIEGKLLKSVKMLAGTIQVRVDGSGFSNGLYFVKLTNGSNVVDQSKFVIVK